MNESEQLIYNHLIKAGWEVHHVGIPDLLCLKDKAIKFVEVKSGWDTVKPHQQDVIDALCRNGYDAQVIYDIVPLNIEAIQKNFLQSTFEKLQSKEQEINNLKQLLANSQENYYMSLCNFYSRLERLEHALDLYYADYDNKYRQKAIHDIESIKYSIQELIIANKIAYKKLLL